MRPRLPDLAFGALRCVEPHRYASSGRRSRSSADGGFGHALEPNLRGPASQPAPTLYALEILNEAGAADGELARDARGWLRSCTPAA